MSAYENKKILCLKYPEFMNFIQIPNVYVFNLNNSLNRHKCFEVNDEIVELLNEAKNLFPNHEFIINAGDNKNNITHAPEKSNKRTCNIVRNKISRLKKDGSS